MIKIHKYKEIQNCASITYIFSVITVVMYSKQSNKLRYKSPTLYDHKLFSLLYYV